MFGLLHDIIRNRFLIATIFIPSLINAQSWQGVEQIGGEGNESCQLVESVGENRQLIGGTFDDNLTLGDKMLQSFGGDDIWIASLDADSQIQWAISAGGKANETIAAMALDQEGNLICAGEYWQEAYFEDQVLTTKSNIKGIYLAKYNKNGLLTWVKSIDGTQLKKVSDLEIDQAGDIYLTGYFEDSLLLEDQVMVSTGNSDLFVMKYNTLGALQWASHDGWTGNTRAISMALTPMGAIVVGGYFDDTTRIAGAFFTANTFDRDVFLAQYDQNGKAQWARKAGGVHDDEIAAVGVNASGQIYATGWLVGVMKLSDSLSIQSKTGQSDFYLLRYGPDGTPLMAKAMGGNEQQQTTDLFCTEDGAIISGIYQGEMIIDGVKVSAGNGFGSFIGDFDSAGNLNKIQNLPTEEVALITNLTRINSEKTGVSGSFRGSLQLGAQLLQDRGPFDGFTATLDETITSLSDEIKVEDQISIFPNPAHTTLNIDTKAMVFKIKLVDVSGRLILQAANQKTINLEQLPPGPYWLYYSDKNGTQRKQLIITP